MKTKRIRHPIVNPGDVFGQLTVLRFSSNKNKNKSYLCKCSCGETKIISVSCLRSGDTRSCGCFRRIQSRKLNFKDGRSKTKLYRVWLSMLRRCYDPKATRFNCYGGRGIVVCKEWKIYGGFRSDMLASYRPGLSIDRINNDGNYEPGNCRWITMNQQAENRQNSLRIAHNGVTKRVVEWGLLMGIPAQHLRRRLHIGWPIVDLLTIPAIKANCGWALPKIKSCIWKNKAFRKNLIILKNLVNMADSSPKNSFRRKERHEDHDQCSDPSS